MTNEHEFFGSSSFGVYRGQEGQICIWQENECGGVVIHVPIEYAPKFINAIRQVAKEARDNERKGLE